MTGFWRGRGVQVEQGGGGGDLVGFQGGSEMMLFCLSFIVEFQKRERRGYLGVNLKFMISVRSVVAEFVIQQVCRRWELGLFLGFMRVRVLRFSVEVELLLGFLELDYIVVLGGLRVEQGRWEVGFGLVFCDFRGFYVVFLYMEIMCFVFRRV